MSDKRDYYEVLGLNKSASAAEIKSAYRKSALKFHPDRNPGDAEAEKNFKEASEAYEVLSDDNKRATYDQFGHAGLSGQGFSGFQDVGDIFSSFGSIFEEFFGFSGGGPGGRTRARRGSDLRYDLKIDFEEAVFGTEKNIEFDKAVNCKECDGEGAPPGGKTTCTMCNGIGQVRRTQGFFSVQTACPSCRGRGVEIKDPCKSCRGQGQVSERKNINVKIPAGVDTGLRLRVTGEGEIGQNGGPAGDLYVVIFVKDHKNFERDGYDIVCYRAVNMAHAALGGAIKIETLEGEEEIEIPPGTQHGTQLKISGAGIPRLKGNGRGDLIVEIHVAIPKKLNKEQREALEKFAKASGEEVTAPSGLFNRIFGD